MNRRQAAMVVALGLFLAAGGAYLLLRARPRVHTVQLRDGRRLEGLIIPYRQGSYLVQSADQCLIIPQSEFSRVDDARVELHGLSAEGDAPIEYETFETIGVSGEVDIHATMRWKNPHARVLNRVRWGYARHEFGYLESLRVRDSFGRELPIEIQDRGEDRKLVSVHLDRPALPGEEVVTTTSYREKSVTWRDGEEWVFRHTGDYPDNRLVTRTVQLPPGAAILEVDPEPLYRLETGERPLVMWRRYFLQGERIPWEIRYRLPSP